MHIRTLAHSLAFISIAVSGANAQNSVDNSRRTAIVRATELVAPAVVSVNVRQRATVQPRSVFESFFLGPATREVQGLGSGFVTRADGIVVTNEHVVRGASEVVVTLSDGRDFGADVVGTDEVTDLAVLRLRGAPRNLPVAPLGTSSNLIIGEWAIAIGNPFGFYIANAEPTVTAGVISAFGRNIVPGGEDSRTYYLDMIQTDASINPGNSGGPLLNAAGEVIGVNSSIISQNGGSVGLGFAIPIDRAKRVVADLLAEGHVRRAWTGLAVEPGPANQFGRSHDVQISSVAPNSPGSRAGLNVGDFIVSVGGRRVTSPLDWEARLLDSHVAEPMSITARSGERERTVRLVPGDLPSLSATRVSALAGLQLITMTPEIRSERRLKSEFGAVIVSLSDEARSVGLAERDLIVEINRQPIHTAEEAANVLKSLAGGSPIRLVFERQGQYTLASFYLRG